MTTKPTIDPAGAEPPPIAAQANPLRDIYREAGTVTCEEARQILGRFNASHWDNATEHARYSIPTNPKRDDDIRLGAFIEQAERCAARVRELEAERDDARRALQDAAIGALAQVDGYPAHSLAADIRSGVATWDPKTKGWWCDDES